MTDHPSVPTPGFFRYRALLEKLPNGRWLRGPELPCVIWFGPPTDPVTGEELDRSPRYQALVDGREIDIEEIWPFVAGDKIEAEEYQKMRENQ